MSPSADGFITCVFGGPGTGKTTLVARAVVRDVSRDFRRAIVYDPTGDMLERLTASSAAGERLPKEKCAVAHTAAGVWKAFEKSQSTLNPRPEVRLIALQPQGSQDLVDLGEEFLKCAVDPRARNFTLVADEAELVYPNAMPRGARLSSLKLTRNWKQRLYCTTQRPQMSATLLRSQTIHACVFGAESEGFIDPGCRELGKADLYERARILRKFHYLYRGPSWARNVEDPLPILDARSSPIPW